MTALTFQPASPTRVAHIAAHLRAADRAELAITSPGEDVADILEYSVAASRWAIVAEVGGVPAVVYGVAPTTDPMVGRAWMLATDDLLKINRREFITRCRKEVRLMQQKFAVLTNEVHCRNTVVIRWLERLGFHIDRERPVGPNGDLFVFWKGAARRV
jgi:hypothetical protein